MDIAPEVVARACARDEDAVAALYRACAGDIHRWIRRRVRNHHTAEDLTQQTFANVLRALPRYEQREGAFPAWLMRIARNVVIDHVRTDQKYALSADPGMYRAAPGGRAEAGDALRDAFAELNPEQRRVAVLRHVVGLGPREIADHMGRSVASVDALHNRSRRILQRELVAREAVPATA
jgi:RNA polymerase sigma-70 factor (ECF subfamily)